MAKTDAPKGKTSPGSSKLSFGPVNYVLFILAVVLIVVGFYLLSRNEITVGPLLLVIAYSFLIPISILVGLGMSREDDEERLIESGTRK